MFLEEVERLILFKKNENEIRLSYYFKDDESNYRTNISFKIASEQELEMEKLEKTILNLSLKSLRTSITGIRNINSKELRKKEIENELLEKEKQNQEKILKDMKIAWKTNGIEFKISKQPIIRIEEYTNGKWMKYLTKKISINKEIESFRMFLCLDNKSNSILKKIPKEVKKTWLKEYADISKNEVRKHFQKNNIFTF